MGVTEMCGVLKSIDNTLQGFFGRSECVDNQDCNKSDTNYTFVPFGFWKDWRWVVMVTNQTHTS